MPITLTDIAKTFHERSLRTCLLRKRPRRVKALQGISLHIRPGEIFGLLGPNGAGKTTLIKILATLVLPDRGEARVCGYDILTQPHQVRRHIGLVHTSERSFYWRLTGRQNLSFFATLHNLSGSEKKRQVEALLETVGLQEKADYAVMKYSSGQQQRLALARALLSEPQVLLMDEPTRSLDPLAASGLRRLTQQTLARKQNKTVLWCTHNLQEAHRRRDRPRKLLSTPGGPLA
jgi:ABC-2 type transport system ATP-binding protein